MKPTLLIWLLLGLLLPACLAFHAGPMPGEPADAKFATIDGVRLRYVDVGEGSPVVLIHGYASSLDTWSGLIPRLAELHRVIALDLKGFGWSDRPAGDYSPEAQAALVRGLLDELKVGRVAVVAHSWGAAVAVALALGSPERVERLALYDAYVYEEQVPMFFLWARAAGVGEALFAMFYNERPDERLALAFHDPSLLSEELAEQVERAMERPGTRAAALAAARGQRFEDVQTRYRGIEKPVLLIWGRDDVVTPLEYGERLLRDLPDARLEVYPQCGHFPMIEAGTASGRDLIHFLAGVMP